MYGTLLLLGKWQTVAACMQGGPGFRELESDICLQLRCRTGLGEAIPTQLEHVQFSYINYINIVLQNDSLLGHTVLDDLPGGLPPD